MDLSTLARKLLSGSTREQAQNIHRVPSQKGCLLPIQFTSDHEILSSLDFDRCCRQWRTASRDFSVFSAEEANRSLVELLRLGIRLKSLLSLEYLGNHSNPKKAYTSFLCSSQIGIVPHSLSQLATLQSWL